MMEKIFHKLRVVLLLLLSAAVLTSCYTKKPFCDAVYEENGVYQIEEPFYKIKLKIGGGALLAGGTAAGGYVGNNANKDYLDQKYNVANTIIGAAIGLGVTAGVMAIFKPYSTHASDPQEWMSKANSNYAYAGKYAEGYYALPVSSEKSFSPSSLEEMKMYHTAFPYSNSTIDKLAIVLPKLNEDELLKFPTPL
jgi:hypothetical protein